MAESKSGGKRYVLNPSDVFPIVVGSDPETDGRPPVTVWQCLADTMSKHGDREAYKACTQLPQDAEKGLVYTSDSDQIYTWRQMYDMSFAFAKALISNNFTAYSAVNILGFNSPEWVAADIGAMMASGLAAGIYATNNAEACQYVSHHSSAQVVVLEGPKQLAKYKAILQDEINGGLPALKLIVAYNMSQAQVAAEKDFYAAKGVQLYEFKEFLESGNAADEDVQARMDAQQPGNCCTLIYTSGTTGNPKAVMISHDNATWTALMLAKQMGGMFATDKVVSYLPLSHIAAQVLDVFGPMVYGCSVTFARPDALKGTLGSTLAAVKPNILFGVPRVWEKIMGKIKAKGATTTGLKKTIATWAKGVGMGFSQAKQGMDSSGNPAIRSASAPCGYSCAHSIVLGKVKGLLGLDNCRACLTGAAPIAKETLEFFAALDVPIFEVYGQSECTGPATVNTPHVGWKIGTVGPTIPGTTMRIDSDSQEIQYTGRHIFMGYMGMQEKTESTLTDDGYLASGDQGAFDEDGFLSITGRIKELIIGAGGENIAPVLIEKCMRKHMSFLNTCIVFGDNKPYLGMFVTLETEVDLSTGLPTAQLTAAAKAWCASVGASCETYEDAKASPEVNAAIEAGMKAANSSGEAGIISRAAQPKFHLWLPAELTALGDTPTLTSTLKLKRSVVNRMYQDVIDAGYDAQSAKFKKKKDEAAKASS